MRSKTISREFFASVATVVILGLGVVCLSQTAMSVGYFASERRAALTGILDGAAAVSDQLAASSSSIVITDTHTTFTKLRIVARFPTLRNPNTNTGIFKRKINVPVSILI